MHSAASLPETTDSVGFSIAVAAGRFEHEGSLSLCRTSSFTESLCSMLSDDGRARRIDRSLYRIDPMVSCSHD